MKKIALFLSIFLESVNCLALEAKLSPNPIMQGESTELIISSDKPLGAPENLRLLTKNFNISGSQQRQSAQFINGVGSTTYEVAFVLFPLRQGEIKIPPLKVGDEKTEPLVLKVLAKNDQSSIPVKDLPTMELTADVSDHTPYEGQTLFYTLTLTDGQGLVGGEIIPAKVENARLNQIGQDKTESVLKNGQRVHEITRSYTLTPEKAGKIEIPPALFNGEVSYQAQRADSKRKFFGFVDAGVLFDGFLNTTRPVSFTSNPIILQVQPKPADIKGWWLPSPKVELAGDYQIPQIVQVGDTISGKFILTAQDVNANDMPVPRLNTTTDFRIYPQPEERTTTVQDKHLIGKVSVPFTLIPLKTGQVEIPEVSVSWFNTVTKKMEKAVVPARPVMVEKGSIAPVLEDTGVPNTSPAPTQKNEPVSQPEPSQHTWIWAIVGVLFGIIVGALLVFLWHIHKTHSKQKKEKPLPDFYPFK